MKPGAATPPTQVGLGAGFKDGYNDKGRGVFSVPFRLLGIPPELS